MKKYIIINLENGEYFADYPALQFTPLLNLAEYFETESAANDKAMKLPSGIYEIKEIIIKN